MTQASSLHVLTFTDIGSHSLRATLAATVSRVEGLWPRLEFFSPMSTRNCRPTRMNVSMSYLQLAAAASLGRSIGKFTYHHCQCHHDHLHRAILVAGQIKKNPSIKLHKLDKREQCATATCDFPARRAAAPQHRCPVLF